MGDAVRLPHPDALPNYQDAVMPPEKFTRYFLNPMHVAHVWGRSSGRDKAVVFKSALGFDLSNWELLRDRILEELPFHEAVLGKEDEFGRRYNVTLPVEGVNGKVANVLTAWIIKTGEVRPSFVTARCV